MTSPYCPKPFHAVFIKRAFTCRESAEGSACNISATGTAIRPCCHACPASRHSTLRFPLAGGNFVLWIACIHCAARNPARNSCFPARPDQVSQCDRSRPDFGVVAGNRVVHRRRGPGPGRTHRNHGGIVCRNRMVGSRSSALTPIVTRTATPQCQPSNRLPLPGHRIEV